MTTNKEKMGMIFYSYYSQLFTVSHSSTIEQCLKHLQPVVSETMNASLLADITKNEIENAVFQMNALGAPGPDDFPDYSFKQIGTQSKKKCVTL